MSDAGRAGLVLGFGVAAIGSYPIGWAALCTLGFLQLAVPIGLGLGAHVLAKPLDPDYSDSPRMARLALGVGRPLAHLALTLAVLSPLWMFAVGEMVWGRRAQGRARALQDARALLDAQQNLRKASGTYVTLECLAEGSRCPAGVKPPVQRSLLEPVRNGYRFAFRGVPQPGARERLDAFAYAGSPSVPPSECALRATGDSLVCADSTGLLCTMTMRDGAELQAARCPAGCVDVRGPRPTPSAQ